MSTQVPIVKMPHQLLLLYMDAHAYGYKIPYKKIYCKRNSVYLGVLFADNNWQTCKFVSEEACINWLIKKQKPLDIPTEPDQVVFQLSYSYVLHILKEYILQQCGCNLNLDLYGFGNFGRLMISYDNLTEKDIIRLKQKKLYEDTDQSSADLLDRILEQYFQFPVSVYCTKNIDGIWITDPLDIVAPYKSYRQKAPNSGRIKKVISISTIDLG